jgi:hypothetical protein
LSAQHSVVTQVPLSQTSQAQAEHKHSPPSQQLQPDSQTPQGQVTAAPATAKSALGRSARPLEAPTTNIDITIAIDLII